MIGSLKIIVDCVTGGVPSWAALQADVKCAGTLCILVVNPVDLLEVTCQSSQHRVGD